MTGVPSLRDDLLQYVASRASTDEALDADTDLLEAELLDSLLVMDIVAHVEATYGLRLDETDIAPRHFRTVSALADLIARKLS